MAAEFLDQGPLGSGGLGLGDLLKISEALGAARILGGMGRGPGG